MNGVSARVKLMGDMQAAITEAMESDGENEEDSRQ